MDTEKGQLNRFEEVAKKAEERGHGLEAIGIVLRLLTTDKTVWVGDAPLEYLVARELGLDNPDRLGAHQEVHHLLKVGGEAVAIAANEERLREADARTMLPHLEEAVPPHEEIH